MERHAIPVRKLKSKLTFKIILEVEKDDDEASPNKSNNNEIVTESGIGDVDGVASDVNDTEDVIVDVFVVVEVIDADIP